MNPPIFFPYRTRNILHIFSFSIGLGLLVCLWSQCTMSIPQIKQQTENDHSTLVFASVVYIEASRSSIILSRVQRVNGCSQQLIFIYLTITFPPTGSVCKQWNCSEKSSTFYQKVINLCTTLSMEFIEICSFPFREYIFLQQTYQIPYQSFPLIQAAIAIVNFFSYWSRATFIELGGRGSISESSQECYIHTVYPIEKYVGWSDTSSYFIFKIRRVSPIFKPA